MHLQLDKCMPGIYKQQIQLLYAAAGLADSDIDLGVFGRFKGTPLEALQRSQRKSLLSMLLKMVHRAHLARHQVCRCGSGYNE